MSSVFSKPDTGENNRTKGGPGYTLGLHKLRISLPICYYFFSLVSSGVEGGGKERENRRRRAGCGGNRCKMQNLSSVFIFSASGAWAASQWLQSSCDEGTWGLTASRLSGNWSWGQWTRLSWHRKWDALPPNPRCHHSSWRVGGWLGHSMFPCFSDPWEVCPHEKDQLKIQRAPVMLCHAK